MATQAESSSEVRVIPVLGRDVIYCGRGVVRDRMASELKRR
jgi:hypothetical protein